MIYLDTSVVLARLFAEDRSPPDAFWSQTFVASRLLEFEVFNRIHAPGGHFKFPHLWPLKLPQAGQSNYGFPAPV